MCYHFKNSKRTNKEVIHSDGFFSDSIILFSIFDTVFFKTSDTAFLRLKYLEFISYSCDFCKILKIMI